MFGWCLLNERKSNIWLVLIISSHFTKPDNFKKRFLKNKNFISKAVKLLFQSDWTRSNLNSWSFDIFFTFYVNLLKSLFLNKFSVWWKLEIFQPTYFFWQEMKKPCSIIISILQNLLWSIIKFYFAKILLINLIFHYGSIWKILIFGKFHL
jgi:hypothetical protein